MTVQQRKLLEKIPVAELAKVVRARKKAAAAVRGPYATLKKFAPCPHCGEDVGVREARRHRSAVSKTGRCPKKLKKAA